MKLPRRPLTRVIALTTAVVVAGGAAAVAQTSVGVGVGVVNGIRALNVTGTDFAGATNLAFRNGTLAAPFGVMVTDAAYSRTGYDVTATLSDLYRLDNSLDDGYDCTSKLDSGDFSLDFTGSGSVLGTAAVLEPVMDFTGSVPVQELLDLGLLALVDLSTLGLVATDTLPVSVADIQGLLDEAAFGSPLMSVANGTVGHDFTTPASHVCAASTGTSRALQGGTPVAPDATLLENLRTQTFTDAATDTKLTVQEAINGTILDTTADDDGGIVWDATYNAILLALTDAGISYDLTDPGDLADLDALTRKVIDGWTTSTGTVVEGLVSTTADFVLNVVGQTGNYRNLPILKLADGATSNVPTGLYHGVMTVTLADR